LGGAVLQQIERKWWGRESDGRGVLDSSMGSMGGVIGCASASDQQPGRTGGCDCRALQDLARGEVADVRSPLRITEPVEDGDRPSRATAPSAEPGSPGSVQPPTTDACGSHAASSIERVTSATGLTEARSMPVDAGMSTVEYAVGTVVAAAFAAVLYRIVTGDSVIAGLTNLINTAMSTSF